MVRSLVLLACCVLAGCGPSTPPQPSVDEYVQKKLDAMTKLAEAAEGPNAEFAVKAALENFREIPFDAKAHAEQAGKILELYRTRVKSRLKGEIAVEVAGEMKLLESQMK